MLHALVTSDFHLEALRKLFPKDHIERQLDEVEKIFQYAIKKGIRHIFIPGDISDTYNMSSDTYFSLVMLLKKYDGLLNIYYLQGNHDWEADKKTSLDLLNLMCAGDMFKTVFNFSKPTQLVIEGIVVNMLPFPAKRSIKNKKPCLNFVHTAYAGAVGDNGRALKVESEIYSKPSDFTVSGHIHKYQFLKKKRVIYFGDPYQKNFGESLPKGFGEIKAYYKKGKLIVKHQFINNHPDFTLESILISKQKDFLRLSKSDSVRYRLFIDPSVVIPQNLMLDFPNIKQILDSQGKTVLKDLICLDEFDLDNVSIPKIDPTSTLKASMKSDGWSRSDYIAAKALILEARS
jgi:DNA repair exonuclease SbcCD nuclease subunit